MARTATPDPLAEHPGRRAGDLGGPDVRSERVSRGSTPSTMGPRLPVRYTRSLGISRDSARGVDPPMEPFPGVDTRASVLLADPTRSDPRYGRTRARAHPVYPQQTRHGPLLGVGLAIMDYPPLSGDDSDPRRSPQNLCDASEQHPYRCVGLARGLCASVHAHVAGAPAQSPGTAWWNVQT